MSHNEKTKQLGRRKKSTWDARRRKAQEKAQNSQGNSDNSAEIKEPEIKYTDSGFCIFSRKWCGRELARQKGAFVVYFHLLAWANHEDGKLRRGQIALGERDFGLQIGMSIVTVRKWLRWLRDNGWISLRPTRHGSQRGTIVTVLHYEEFQSFKTYAVPAAEQEAIFVPLPTQPSIGNSLPI